jgi:hypothetical protein
MFHAVTTGLLIGTLLGAFITTGIALSVDASRSASAAVELWP